ncbi:alpha/beta fold hydrolase [Corynebacterium ulcerans]|uniref:alpha/beta fold hydrolase n=1 Tax=Corynebacterium ulcerans TaxID=65058 RepID=UPI00051F5F5E|nr:alpha/beta hydrolase [Corynebacterium ulcerans]AIT90148.1 Alpha/beta hydrolase [Corynebacterium ulcerans]ALD95946.1 Alpha/beta hydrolase [Corynebacterium ulcerans]MBH5295502.1 alpha/beta hydrolase [Corynebacterium ulcerans]MBH5302781.1 alpha/beta hydrolase [Corynebacterium ulcerans]MBL4944633.1 alpha/beta hydrolase [Corynebacterium ulcerans]
MSHRIEILQSGCRLVGEVRGHGTDVVLVHGAGMDRRMYDLQVAPLQDAGCRVLTMDMRGHGESRPAVAVPEATPESDVLAMMDDVGMNSAVLVGQSLGGNVCQSLARTSPDRVRALVIIDSAWNREQLTPLDRLSLWISTPLLRVSPWSWLVDRMARASAATPEGVALARRSFSQLSKGEFLHAWELAKSELSPQHEGTPDLPLLLICGEKDGTGEILRSMRKWADETGVPLHIVPGAGHLSNVDRPDFVNQVLLDFLAQFHE